MSQDHVSEAGCVRVGPIINNIYDFCLGSSFLNLWTAIQISHNFNGIFGFNNDWQHFKYLHKLFIMKNSLSFTYYDLFYRIGDVPLDSKYQMLLDLKITFSKKAQARISFVLALLILNSLENHVWLNQNCFFTLAFQKQLISI